MKDMLKENLAKWVQTKLLSGNTEDARISGLSAPPGCGDVEVKDAVIDVRPLDNTNTSILIRTPAGPRHFEVKFKETY